MKAIINIKQDTVRIDIVNELGGLVARRRVKRLADALQLAADRGCVSISYEL